MHPRPIADTSSPFFQACRYLLHDRDTKYVIMPSGGFWGGVGEPTI
jgi:hypothetical protein